MIVQLITPAMIKFNVSSEAITDSVLTSLNKPGRYKVVREGNGFRVNIDGQEHFVIMYDNGTLVSTYQYELDDSTPYEEILKSKEAKTREIINREGAFVGFLKELENVLKAENSILKDSYFFNQKYVSYSLATYKIESTMRAVGYSLALKRQIDDSQIDDLKEQSLKIVNVNDSVQLLLIWGARVLIGTGDFSDKLYNDYVRNECEAQYLWFIITALDKKIDYYMLHETGRAADLSMLLDTSYSVLYRKSRFDGVVSSKSHRYELEIFNSIIAASKIDYLYNNLEQKIRLLKEKSSLVEEKINKQNRKFVNVLLGIISLLSAISTIYGFVSVFQEGDKKITYIIVTVVAVVLFGVANLFQFLGRRKLRGKTKKKDR